MVRIVHAAASRTFQNETRYPCDCIVLCTVQHDASVTNKRHPHFIENPKSFCMILTVSSAERALTSSVRPSSSRFVFEEDEEENPPDDKFAVIPFTLSQSMRHFKQIYELREQIVFLGSRNSTIQLKSLALTLAVGQAHAARHDAGTTLPFCASTCTCALPSVAQLRFLIPLPSTDDP